MATASNPVDTVTVGAVATPAPPSGIVTDLSVKSRLGDELRRFHLPTGASFDDLRRVVKAVHGIPDACAPSGVTLTYADEDGDAIRIASTPELLEAAAAATGTGVLRISVVIPDAALAVAVPVAAVIAGEEPETMRDDEDAALATALAIAAATPTPTPTPSGAGAGAGAGAGSDTKDDVDVDDDDDTVADKATTGTAVHVVSEAAMDAGVAALASLVDGAALTDSGLGHMTPQQLVETARIMGVPPCRLVHLGLVANPAFKAWARAHGPRARSWWRVGRRFTRRGGKGGKGGKTRALTPDALAEASQHGVGVAALRSLGYALDSVPAMKAAIRILKRCSGRVDDRTTALLDAAVPKAAAIAARQAAREEARRAKAERKAAAAAKRAVERAGRKARKAARAAIRSAESDRDAVPVAIAVPDVEGGDVAEATDASATASDTADLEVTAMACKVDSM